MTNKVYVSAGCSLLSPCLYESTVDVPMERSWYKIVNEKYDNLRREVFLGLDKLARKLNLDPGSFS